MISIGDAETILIVLFSAGCSSTLQLKWQWSRAEHPRVSFRASMCGTVPTSSQQAAKNMRNFSGTWELEEWWEPKFWRQVYKFVWRLMLHGAAQCCIELHNIAWGCTMLHRAAQCCMDLHNVAGSCTMLYGTAQCCMELHNVSWDCTMLHGAAQCCMELHNVAWGCTIWKWLNIFKMTNKKINAIQHRYSEKVTEGR